MRFFAPKRRNMSDNIQTNTTGRLTFCLQQKIDKTRYVSKVDPENCETAEMYAYTANLKESGKDSFDTVLKAAVAKAVKNAEQKSAGAWSFMEEVRL